MSFKYVCKYNNCDLFIKNTQLLIKELKKNTVFLRLTMN